MKYQNHRGFTLIEVLIASVILFSALAITAELYSASSLAATKATQRVKLYQLSPIAMTAIKAQLHQQTENRQLTELSGQLTLLGVDFSWQAKRQKFGSRPMTYYDEIPPRAQFGLFVVNVVATSNKQVINRFDFKVVSW